MKTIAKFTFILSIIFFMTSCVSKKKFGALQTEYDTANQQLGQCGQKLNAQLGEISTLKGERDKLKGDLQTSSSLLRSKEEQILLLKEQIEDMKSQRDKQVSQLDELTSLSQSANENIKETLAQLESKDKYINLLQAAKTRTDSINLALAVNLKSVLNDGIEEEDVEVKVDKTVVFVNLSDKMLFKVGSSNITPRAKEVLGKIAQIIESRPDLEVMVEGYTDNQPISTNCTKDNWDLSVKRATSVIRVLQNDYKVDPNRLIAAGRGEYNTLATNDTAEGRATNRRTRIIILPKLDEFYDLLNPNGLKD